MGLSSGRRGPSFDPRHRDENELVPAVDRAVLDKEPEKPIPQPAVNTALAQQAADKRAAREQRAKHEQHQGSRDNPTSFSENARVQETDKYHTTADEPEDDDAMNTPSSQPTGRFTDRPTGRLPERTHGASSTLDQAGRRESWASWLAPPPPAASEPSDVTVLWVIRAIHTDVSNEGQ